MFCLLLIALPFGASNFKVSANEEANYEWEDNGDGTVTITDYVGTSKDVIIPSQLGGKDVTHIGHSAFQQKGLKTVIIPDGVTYIGGYAFASNELTSIVLPDSVVRIDTGVFEWNNLKDVTLSANLTNISTAGFSYNEIEAIHIPNTVKEIGGSAFKDNKMTEIHIPENVNSIHLNPFAYNKMETITVDPNNTAYKSINDQGLYTIFGTTLIAGTTTGQIDGGVKEISFDAFAGYDLEQITIPNSVEKIAARALQDNKLNEVVLPDNVTEIGHSAFSNNGLTSVILSQSLVTIGQNAFEKNKLTTIVLPNTLELIGRNAFRHNKLTELTIPNSVTTIEPDAFRNNQLTNVTLGTGLTVIDDGVFSINKLTSINIPEGVTTIEYGAFKDNQIEEVIIPEGVTEIYGNAFNENNLSKLIIPESVTTIGDYAFMGVFETITVHPNNQHFSDQNNLGLFNKDGTIMYAATKAGASNFPPGLTSIAAYAFENFGLTSVHIPDSVVEIGDNAFANNNITEIVIGENLTDIGNDLFFNNPVETIIVDTNNMAFSDQGGIGLYNKNGSILYQGTKSGEIAEGTVVIYFDAFNNVGISGHLIIPNSVQFIAPSAFARNDITKLTIGSGVEPFDGISGNEHMIGFAFIGNLIEEIYVDEQNQSYEFVNGNTIYTKDGKALVFGTKDAQIQDGTEELIAFSLWGWDGSIFNFPESVDIIMYYSVAFTSNIEHIVIRNKDTFIEDMAFIPYTSWMINPPADMSMDEIRRII